MLQMQVEKFNMSSWHCFSTSRDFVGNQGIPGHLF